MKSSAFQILTADPLNGAPAHDRLVRSAVTDTSDFFVRNHGAGPAPGTLQSLRVSGLVRQELTIPLDDAAGNLALPFAARTIVSATLQCAGNRRTALQSIRPIPNEVPWDSTAISNAEWRGVRLADVLAHAGVLPGAAHVWFTGADVLSGKHAGQQFGGSIPLEKAMHPSTLLADTMNGAPLPPGHGGPLRALVPGYIGARSVKWLSEIRVEREPSPNHFQRAYSVFPPDQLSVPAHSEGGRVLGEFPVSSAFGDPADGSSVGAGVVALRGWAITGGERTVERVEVSANGGATWFDAQFTAAPAPFVWRLWRADCTLAPGTHTLLCRATDSAGNTQPADARAIWNVKGYANNCWDAITVHTR